MTVSKEREHQGSLRGSTRVSGAVGRALIWKKAGWTTATPSSRRASERSERASEKAGRTPEEAGRASEKAGRAREGAGRSQLASRGGGHVVV